MHLSFSDWGVVALCGGEMEFQMLLDGLKGVFDVLRGWVASVAQHAVQRLFADPCFNGQPFEGDGCTNKIAKQGQRNGHLVFLYSARSKSGILPRSASVIPARLRRCGYRAWSRPGFHLVKGDFGDVRELAVEVVIVEAVAYHKIIVDRKPSMVGLEFDGAVRLFIE